MQRKPLHDEGVTELPGYEFREPLTRPIGNSNSEKVEEGYLEQMVFLKKWKRKCWMSNWDQFVNLSGSLIVSQDRLMGLSNTEGRKQ